MKKILTKSSTYQTQLRIRKNQTRNKEEQLSKYLDRKLRRNYRNKKGYIFRDRRPKELKYLHMAKASGLTYKQARNRIDYLVKNGILEKFQAWNKNYQRVNYYRFTDW